MKELKVLEYKAKQFGHCNEFLSTRENISDKTKLVMLKQVELMVEAFEEGYDAASQEQPIKELTAPEQIEYIDSREVAQAIGKNHHDLLRDIRNYISYLGESNFAFTDFFLESNYLTEQNKTLPCYLISQKGCELIAHKMTGLKGTQFSAWYINKFHEMKNIISNKITPQNDSKLKITGKPEGMLTATEIGQRLGGISKRKIGLITNKYNLKTNKYGKWIKCVASSSDKPVDTFMYYPAVIEEIEKHLK